MRLGVLTVFAVVSCVMFGQGGTGTISGSATDTTGAIVPGTVVTAVNELNGFTRSTTVGNAGEFTLTGMQPGTYTITAEQKAFKTFSLKGLSLEVGQNARIEVHLEVGNVAEVVEVTGETALLQTEQSSVGAVINQQKIVDFR
jgi:hypothetical protein